MRKDRLTRVNQDRGLPEYLREAKTQEIQSSNKYTKLLPIYLIPVVPEYFTMTIFFSFLPSVITSVYYSLLNEYELIIYRASICLEKIDKFEFSSVITLSKRYGRKSHG